MPSIERQATRPMAIILRFILLAAFIAALPATSSAIERFEAKSWRRVKTHDMAALQKIDPLPLRQIVGVRFGYRAKDIRHLKPNWFYSSIWNVTRNGNRADFSHIPVMVAMADLEAFRALPTTPESAGKFVVYGQVLKDAEAGFLFLRLMGTKVKNEKRGRVAVTW
jgi:hypothetical protein